MEKLDSLLDIDAASVVIRNPVTILVIPDQMPLVAALIASAEENQKDIGDAQQLQFRSKRSVC